MRNITAERLARGCRGALGHIALGCFALLALAASQAAETPAPAASGSPAAAKVTQTTEQSGAAVGQAATTAEKSEGLRGRLPAYYGQVVDEKQREAIYAIQAEYAERIAELQVRLEALMAERNAKIEAVLTPAQRQKLDELKAAAQRKRAEKRGQSADGKAVEPAKGVAGGAKSTSGTGVDANR